MKFQNYCITSAISKKMLYVNNNNISISGKYKLLWWDQDETFSQFKTFLMKIGLVEELAYWNQNLTNLEVQDCMTESVLLTFGFDWDRMNHTERIVPGQLVEEEVDKAIGG